MNKKQETVLRYVSEIWKKMPVKVSCVLISYNHEHYIRQALESILLQSYPAEIIISDDFSHDNTFNYIREKIKNYIGPHDIRVLIPDRNKGVCRNQNKAIQNTHGELIVLFEGDDISRKDRIQKIVETYLMENRQVAALGSSVRIIDKKGAPIRSMSWSYNNGNAKTMQKQGWEVVGCGLAFRRDVFDAFGPISHRLISGDIAIWLRAGYIEKGGMKNIHEYLVDYRKHDANVSSGVKINYSSQDNLKKSCLTLLKNEVAQIREMKKIKKYLSTKKDLSQMLKTTWIKGFKIAQARAKLVLGIAYYPPHKWIIFAMPALRYKPLRPIAARAIALSLLPKAHEIYKKIKNEKNN